MKQNIKQRLRYLFMISHKLFLELLLEYCEEEDKEKIIDLINLHLNMINSSAEYDVHLQQIYFESMSFLCNKYNII